jgi:hypothetical protein
MFIANTILNSEKLSKIRNKARRSTSIQHSTGVLDAIRQVKGNKKYPNKKELKLSPFADNMILYLENSKDSTPSKKIFELT